MLRLDRAKTWRLPWPVESLIHEFMLRPNLAQTLGFCLLVRSCYVENTSLSRAYGVASRQPGADLDDAAAAATALAAPAAPRQELVLVASLIDKAANVAGLTRTCEVMRSRPLRRSTELSPM